MLREKRRSLSLSPLMRVSLGIGHFEEIRWKKQHLRRLTARPRNRIPQPRNEFFESGLSLLDRGSALGALGPITPRMRLCKLFEVYPNAVLGVSLLTTIDINLHCSSKLPFDFRFLIANLLV